MPTTPELLALSRKLTRRRFVTLTAGGAALLAIGAACGDDDDEAPGGTATPGPATDEPRLGTALVGDVLDHALSSDDWPGDFGFVTFKLWPALVDGEQAYYIRTDSSDQAYAEQEKLVFVPLLAEAAKADSGLADLYLFTNGTATQAAVLSTAPHREDYSPAFRLHRVTFAGAARELDSVAAIEEAEAAGDVTLERTGIVLNHPVVKWPGGEMPQDDVRQAYLGDGQLLGPVDVAGGKVTFKLHSCYPSSRYIVTDVTAAPMAEGMHIAPAPGAAALTAAGATAKILVFGNGLEGSGPMGFQKSVTDTVVGDAKWSPFWDHYTFTWSEGVDPAVLKAETEIIGREEKGDLTRFPGTPDTNGQLFMVNCPVPVVAPVA